MRVAVVHDVSAERRLAKMKDNMLAVVSHELRTPLTPIKASAQLLRTRYDRLPDEQRELLLSQIEDRADHLTRLVSDLLLVGSLSASGRSDVQVDLVPADLAELVRDAGRHLAISHPGHTIDVSAPPRLPTATDPVRLRQIIDNLVDNACKYSPGDSRVHLLVSEEGPHAVLRVVDAGRGIPPEHLNRVFERFERVEDPMVMTTSGAGLGLYIVKELTEALGGTVQLDSALGKGTTVSVRLPLRRRASDAQTGLPGIDVPAPSPRTSA
jgi:signal transduction histidine kinase